MKEYFITAELKALATDLDKLASATQEMEAENEEKLKSKTPYPLKRPEVLSEVEYIQARLDALTKYLNPRRPQ